MVVDKAGFASCPLKFPGLKFHMREAVDIKLWRYEVCLLLRRCYVAWNYLPTSPHQARVNIHSSHKVMLNHDLVVLLTPTFPRPQHREQTALGLHIDEFISRLGAFQFHIFFKAYSMDAAYHFCVAIYCRGSKNGEKSGEEIFPFVSPLCELTLRGYTFQK